ncbi:hypothetical protein ANO11243_086100 [Dothideomycetidae sp. 11243]|nr:hypothetical protein ANO11243_086100 [fungal sp. No.11243]
MYPTTSFSATKALASSREKRQQHIYSSHFHSRSHNVTPLQLAKSVRSGIKLTTPTMPHLHAPPGRLITDPARSQELISRLVPARLDFNRQVQSQALGVIFGSVTAADVAAAVTHELSTNDEASRVIVTEEDVTFIDVKGDDGHSSTRVKSLGRFTVEIKVKGAEGPVTRTINVTSQEPEHKPLVE